MKAADPAGPAEQASPAARARRCRVVHAWLSEETYAELEREASRRGMHIDRLVATYLQTIARDGLSKGRQCRR